MQGLGFPENRKHPTADCNRPFTPPPVHPHLYCNGDRYFPGFFHGVRGAGGVAENTPTSRDFAIRFIHAPMLSVFSGFRWTDTTQGFRAYSRKMLLDTNIAPFRDVFVTYELLAYLSCRAPKLGYKCVELPTVRRYPKGDVPTKISSFRGNLSVFKVLIKACFGKYNSEELSK